MTLLFVGAATKNQKLFKRLVNFVNKKGLPDPVINIIKKAVQKSGALGPAMIFSGIFVSAVSFMGCCGAWCSQKLLKMYKKCLWVMVLIILVAGVFAYREPAHLTPFIAKGLAKIFPHYDKNIARQATTITQAKGKCCGALGPHDWNNNGPFQAKFDEYNGNRSYPVYGSAPVPDACCVKKYKGCGLANNDTHTEAFEAIMEEVVRNAERQKFEDDFKLAAEEEWDESDFYDCPPGDHYCKEQMKQEGGFEDFDSYGEMDWEAYEDAHANDYYYYEDTLSYKYSSPYDSSPNDYSSPSNAALTNARVVLDYEDVEDEDINEIVDAAFNYRNMRFTSPGAMGAPPENQYIYKYGCAVKLGQRIQQGKKWIAAAFFMMMLPELICIWMAKNIEKWRDMEEEE